uniref:L1 transposable element RRM domain-containing protein n=1 Tax=Poecilia formosa TaxID=48698 RepID=A0A087YS91_POEFO
AQQSKSSRLASASMGYSDGAASPPVGSGSSDMPPVNNESTVTDGDGLAAMEAGSTNDLVAAINSMKDDFVKRFDSLLTAIQGVQSDIRIVAARVTQAEDRISANEDSVASLQADNTATKTTIEALQLKIDDLENRSRRSNLRLIGLPEGSEGSDMCAFLEKWLPEVLGAETFPIPLIIERAHRVGRVDAAGTRSRAVVMKLLNYADKVRIMKAARTKGEIRLKNNRVMFFPDVSAELLKKRKIFDQVKKDLASISLELPELPYGVVHPATLLVTYKKKRHAFDKAAEAESFVLQLQRERNLVANQVEVQE